MTEYSYELKIPKDRVAVLIGKEGEVKSSIEEDTHAKIKIDSKEGDIFVSGEDALGRSYQVSAFSAMIDEDHEATIIKSRSNTLRFEKNRLLIDGYVCAEIAAEMKNFDILFTDDFLSVTADGIEILKRSRENPDLAGLSY